MLEFKFEIKSYSDDAFQGIPEEQIFALLADIEGNYQIRCGDLFAESDSVVPNLFELAGFFSMLFDIDRDDMACLHLDGEPLFYAYRVGVDFYQMTRTKTRNKTTQNGASNFLCLISAVNLRNIEKIFISAVEKTFGTGSRALKIIFTS